MESHQIKKYIDDKLVTITNFSDVESIAVNNETQITINTNSGQVVVLNFANVEDTQEGLALLESKLCCRWDEEFEATLETDYGSGLEMYSQHGDGLINLSVRCFGKDWWDNKQYKVKTRKGCIQIEKLES